MGHWLQSLARARLWSFFADAFRVEPGVTFGDEFFGGGKALEHAGEVAQAGDGGRAAGLAEVSAGFGGAVEEGGRAGRGS